LFGSEIIWSIWWPSYIRNARPPPHMSQDWKKNSQKKKQNINTYSKTSCEMNTKTNSMLKFDKWNKNKDPIFDIYVHV
jgi:hypothetical protein